eukprot:Gb_06939 [translate_table: standard]
MESSMTYMFVFLNLRWNKFQDSIPPEIGELKKLKNLHLSFNNLKGPIPKELGSLPELRYLYVHENRLTGRIPPELGNLPNLRKVVDGFLCSPGGYETENHTFHLQGCQQQPPSGDYKGTNPNRGLLSLTSLFVAIFASSRRSPHDPEFLDLHSEIFSAHNFSHH